MNTGRFTPMALLVVLTAGIACAADPQGQDTPNIISKENTLLVISVPTNLDTYIVPQSDAFGPFGVYHFNDKKYLVGRTPIQVKLEPDRYSVTVVYKQSGDPSLSKGAPFRKDSESRLLFSLREGGRMVPYAKVYEVEQVAGHAYLVTALFWREDQSLAEFASLLPKKVLFDMAKPSSFVDTFEKANIPVDDQLHLLEMLLRTGKFVWYSEDKTKRVVESFNELRPRIAGATQFIGNWGDDK